jgi:hypothetical protein
MTTFFKSILPIVMAIIALGCYAQTNKYVDINGYYNLMNAPQTNSKYKAQSTENEDGSYTTNIYNGKKLLQSFKHEATSGEVRFADMNFDGYVDLFVGPASSRTYNTIYLYNKKTGKFVPTQKEASLNGFFLVNDNKKHFVSLGSNGASSTIYSKYIWNGNKLEVSESLMVFSDPSEYTENGVTTKFTLIKGNDYYSLKSIGCVKLRTNKFNKLPKEWQIIIYSFDDMYYQL